MQPKPRKPRKTGIDARIFLRIASGIGAVAFCVGIAKLLMGKSEGAFALIVFGLMWSLVPIAISYGLRIDAKKLADEKTKRRTDPTPWLRRPDWARGEIVGTENRLSFAYFLGAGVALVFGFGIYNFVADFGGASIAKAIAAILVLVAPTIMFGLGIRAVSRKKSFGQSIFRLASVPGEIGGQLKGTIEIGGKVRPVKGFQLALRCLHVIRTGGKNRKTRTEILWEEKTTVHDLADSPGKSTLPVSFQIPAECEETDAADPNDQIIWHLEARASVPGVDYLAHFELPVFKGAQ